MAPFSAIGFQAIFDCQRTMKKILAGISSFRQQVFPSQRTEFERLASKQQRPRALFITCADSRVSPNLITQTDPGDLFLLRNAGNIIPPYGSTTTGEAATIEYAVSVLGIRNIIICGHSHCGAMATLLSSEMYERFPVVKAWFSNAEATKRIASEKFRGLSGDEFIARVTQQNVLVQMGNLRTHPSIAVGEATGELRLYGWYYCIETGEVLGYSAERGEFVDLCASTYAEISSGAGVPMLDQEAPGARA